MHPDTRRQRRALSNDGCRRRDRHRERVGSTPSVQRRRRCWQNL